MIEVKIEQLRFHTKYRDLDTSMFLQGASLWKYYDIQHYAIAPICSDIKLSPMAGSTTSRQTYH